MTDPLLGTIFVWPINYPPRGYAYCEGQLLPISENQALFSLLGTVYGGDGRTSFALPDFRSRVVAGQGQAPGINYPFRLGQRGGVEANSLTADQCPTHSHANSMTTKESPAGVTVAVPATTLTANKNVPANDYVLGAAKTSDASISAEIYSSSTAKRTTLEPFSVPATVQQDIQITNVNAGSSALVDNRQPFLAMHYIIALVGVYPQRN